jgi:16S rRNA processing protein RimM
VKTRWVQLGIVGKAHGLNGAFFISRRDEPMPNSVRDVRIGPDPEQAASFHVLGTRNQGDRQVLSLRGLTSREAAESLISLAIWCARDDVMIDENEEYLWADLIGKEVLDSDGQHVGQIKEVGNFGASDIVRLVHAKKGVLELPFVRQYFEMSFSKDQSQVRLLFPLAHFEEFWSPR